MIPLSLR